MIAGWTGRNVEALEKHIRELEALGVKRPKSTPIFYRVAADLLTNAGAIEVLGDHSSGEVEFVLLSLTDGLWVAVGSDHTDRKAEAIGVSLSKQMCAKPISRQGLALQRSSSALGAPGPAFLRQAQWRHAASTRKARLRRCARPTT